jgi:hypothetical protein
LDTLSSRLILRPRKDLNSNKNEADNNDEYNGGSDSEQASINVAVMTKTIATDFITTWQTADDISLQSGWQVFATMATILILGAIGFVSAYKFDQLEEVANRTKQDLLASTSKLKSRSTKRLHVANSDTDILQKSLPIAFGSETFLKRFVTEGKRYHRWFGIVFFYSPHFSRVMRFMSLLVSVISMIFVQAVTYNVAEPDDGSCAKWQTEEECLSEKSGLARDASMCYWSDSNSSCYFQETSNDIMRTLYVATVSSLISAPVALFQNWILHNILSGTNEVNGENEEVNEDSIKNVHMRSNILVPNIEANSTLLRKKYLNNSVQDEFQLLVKQIRAYREILSAVDRKEFDSKL